MKRPDDSKPQTWLEQRERLNAFCANYGHACNARGDQQKAWAVWSLCVPLIIGANYGPR